MRSQKTTLLVLALAAMVVTAWAGDNAPADQPKAQKDNGNAVVPAQPANEEEKPDRANQPKPRDEQAPRSEDKGVQAPERRSDNAQTPRTEQGTTRAPESRPRVNQAPTSEQPERNYTEPARIQTRQSDREPNETGETNVLRSGGEPNRRRGSGSGGYKGGGRHDPFDRRATHYFGGHGWHGHHDHWRHRHFHGSWRFLFHLGPVIYYPPIHYPHVIRIPRDRAGVYVRYTGEDAVGAEFARSVREQLRDQGLRVVYSQDNARLELYIISMEQDPDDPGYGSSISVSYVWYPGHRFITAQMVDAGLNQVDDLAASVAAYADDLVDEYR